MKKTLKPVWKVVSAILKVAAMLLVILLLTPLGYFVWRSGQPMSMPEYDGRTYYELLAERRQAYADLAAKYQIGHPTVDVKSGMCFQAELAVTLVSTFPWSGICAASEFIPVLRVYGSRSKELGCGQLQGTWRSFPATWWNTYERILYNDILVTASHGPVPYCRIPVP